MTKNTQDRTELMLDQALEMTFPASDPIAIYVPEETDDSSRVLAVGRTVRPVGC
jgi:hypothetical protein